MQDQKKRTIENILKRICAHSLFSNSSTYNRLLEYLVEKAFLQEDLKEYIIGADLFGKHYSQDKNDGTVRSYMYKLRKKLAQYYEETETKDEFVFVIEKGQYNLSFIPANDYFQQQIKAPQNLTIPVKYLKTAGIFVLIIVALTWGGKMMNGKYTRMWQPFFKSKAKNMVVISDQYIVHEKLSDSIYHGILYGHINSNKDLLDHKLKNKGQKLLATDYTLMSKMAPLGIKTLANWFTTNSSDFEMQLESQFGANDFQSNNIVFIGQSKTMNLSRSLFLKDSKAFSVHMDGFKYKTNSETKIYEVEFNRNGRVEYAMVSYSTLTSGKAALYFVSNHDIGVIATLRRFTDKAWLKEFTRNLPEGTVHFNALFEVSGIQRTDVSCKLVELEVVDK